MYGSVAEVEEGSALRGFLEAVAGIDTTISRVPERLDSAYTIEMSKLEMTQAQFQRAMNSKPSSVIGAIRPVEMVYGFECSTAMRRLALAIPTGAQCEYVVRAGSSTSFPPGPPPDSLDGLASFADRTNGDADGNSLSPACAEIDDGHGLTVPVGGIHANPFGIHDLSENVWSWCGDDYRATYRLLSGDGRNGP